MKLSEQEFLEICKREIEEKFSFGYKQNYTQRDLVLLIRHIEEKTGVIISLSTLKRVWKSNFKQNPQIATLDALVRVLDYENWQEFKLKYAADKKTTTTKNIDSFLKRKLSYFFYGLIALSGVLFVVWLSNSNQKSIVEKPLPIYIKGPISFTADKTITKGVPNTVIFNYDVSNVEADSFHIQLSWNRFRKNEISSKDNVFSSIYYESGFHRAKLMANDSIIAIQSIHILSDGWEPHVYYSESDPIFIDFKNEAFIENGKLHLSKELLKKKNIDLTKYFKTRATYSKAFNVSSNNFSFSTRMKLDSIINTNCPWMYVMITTEKDVLNVKLIQKGCERFAWYKFGEISKGGRNNDLSALGQDVFNWQDIGINVQNKNVEVIINGEAVFKETLTEDLGEVVGITYVFEGKGSVDYVRLFDAKENPVFEDDFD